MAPARLAVLAIAAIAAVGAVLIMRGMVGGPRPAAAEVAAPVATPMAEVLTATRELTAGERLMAADLTWTQWPEAATGTFMVIRKAEPEAVEAYVDAYVRAPIAEGEPIQPSRVLRTGDASLMAAMLTPGMRAVALPISAESAVGGFILSGDRVDVLMTRELDADGESRGSSFSTHTILTNVRVLAIDQAIETQDGASAVVGSTATLELTPPEVELLYQASASGRLRLALRSVADSVVTRDELRAAGLTPQPVRSTVQVYRYGGVSRVAIQETPERAQ